MNLNEDHYALMAKCIFSEASQEELSALSKLLKENVHLREEYALLYEILKPTTSKDSIQNTPKNTSSDIIKKAVKLQKLTTYKRNFLLVAAAVTIITIGIFSWLEINTHPQKTAAPSFAKIISKATDGERKKIILKDGSTVWLNSGTQLFYANDFEGATREVTLKGEAFFDVTKQKGKPFIVHTDAIDIHVLGTSFNVKAYENENHIETTLYEGAVNVTYKNSQSLNPIKLVPHQKLIIRKEILPVAVTKNSSNTIKESFVIEKIDSTLTDKQTIETAWKYNRLEFNNEPLSEIAIKMERWYNVKIVIEDETLKLTKFYGSFKNETIDQALNALQIASPFKYKINNTHEVQISK